MTNEKTVPVVADDLLGICLRLCAKTQSGRSFKWEEEDDAEGRIVRWVLVGRTLGGKKVSAAHPILLVACAQFINTAITQDSVAEIGGAK